jgi:hypothetical protein
MTNTGWSLQSLPLRVSLTINTGWSLLASPAPQKQKQSDWA